MVSHTSNILVIVSLFLSAFSKTASNPCEGLDLVFVNDNTSCSNYFSCLHGVAFSKTCPDGRWFYDNPVGCHLPRTVNCNVCPKTGVISVGVSESCTKYTLCINGNSFDRECAPETWFDRVEGRCNLQELVSCEYSRCPENRSTLTADPTSCRHYLICVDGEEIARRECNGNLLFDSLLSSCALPENVDCASRPRTNMLLSSVPLSFPLKFFGNLEIDPTEMSTE